MLDQDIPGSKSAAPQQLLRSPTRAAVLMFLVVMIACLFGIYSRPVGFLANVWPANAIALGLLLRVPASASPAGWLAMALAYMSADLLTGSTLIKALLLNGANMVSIGTAYAVFTRFPCDIVKLRQPIAVFCMLLACAAGAGAAGVVGGLANPLLFGGGILRGWIFWFATELINYIAILPVLLAASTGAIWHADSRPSTRPDSSDILPVVALVVSCLAALVIGGPGAIAFPVPALLWCSLVYPLFPTTVLTLIFSLWAMATISTTHVFQLSGAVDEVALISIRLGTSLVALAPIMLASVMQGRNELLGKLHDLATRDSLTGTNNRNAFLEGARRLHAQGRPPFALLMFDIDHFKAINDTYGHAGGDEVLKIFVRRIENALRPRDLFGRLGGEEFAAFIPDCPPDDAIRIAERLKQDVTASPVVLQDGRTANMTTSIGIVLVTAADNASLDDLLAEADALLYRAKNNGRNRYESVVRGAAPARSKSPAAPRRRARKTISVTP